jgi:hypothetical protein
MLATVSKAKMGRPKAAAAQAVLYVRMPAAELSALEAAAKRAGFVSFSEWVRVSLRRESARA